MSARFDIGEAGNCFALERYTACVFHLMRTMEIGLTVLAKKFNVSTAMADWSPMIENVETAISDISKGQNKPLNWRDDREYYSQCASYFRIVKDAWRNYTAHARSEYREGQASDIYTNVRGFMQRLSERLCE